ncbi:MAG: RHS repeat-associated core domain-containing protein [Limisphaerales bacterium]
MKTIRIDEPVRLTRGAGRFYDHAAALGTVTELTGWLGHVRERYEYDVYGQPTIRDAVGNLLTNSAFGNRFLFQGRDRDPDTGLYHFRYRTYSPTVGRFLQVDPIGNPAFDQARRGGYASLDLGDSIEDASFGDGPSRYAFFGEQSCGQG